MVSVGCVAHCVLGVPSFRDCAVCGDGVCPDIITTVGRQLAFDSVLSALGEIVRSLGRALTGLWESMRAEAVPTSSSRWDAEPAWRVLKVATASDFSPVRRLWQAVFRSPAHEFSVAAMFVHVEAAAATASICEAVGAESEGLDPHRWLVDQ